MMVFYISTNYIISIHDVFENQFGINTFRKCIKWSVTWSNVTWLNVTWHINRKMSLVPTLSTQRHFELDFTRFQMTVWMNSYWQIMENSSSARFLKNSSNFCFEISIFRSWVQPITENFSFYTYRITYW